MVAQRYEYYFRVVKREHINPADYGYLFFFISSLAKIWKIRVL